VDEGGKRYAGEAVSPSWAAETGRLEDVPAALREELGHGLLFTGLDRAEGTWALVCIYPENRIKRDYPFTIRDVPLP
jgi:hypothetical protein